MSKELSNAQIEKILTTDARRKSFKQKLLKLGMSKNRSKVNKIMEKMRLWHDVRCRNKKVARAVAQTKNEKDLEPN